LTRFAMNKTGRLLSTTTARNTSMVWAVLTCGYKRGWRS
jgi:hypothetical protein